MREKDFNSIIRNVMHQGGFAEKLKDPPGAVATSFGKLPFDGFGVYNKNIIYWEAKFLSGGYQSFNFNRIEDHQVEALSRIYNWSLKNDYDFVKPIVLLGIWESRKYFHVYGFPIKLILELRTSGKNSLVKKDLLLLKENNLFEDVYQKEFDLQNVLNKSEMIYETFSPKWRLDQLGASNEFN